ncbi:Aminopeptidase S [Maioricimonas rarisocia]|uniref:Aminopeptidase S n=1 Tax=Maioricimonas rarisocia TaxID=2528026 RepID=A0A517ZAD2_9PLAN|nr:M28 family peptidase [Maioricimonas rarisocia]QDU39379.1 Aminopeptidase S [Maioricimonas rarisocia]
MSGRFALHLAFLLLLSPLVSLHAADPVAAGGPAAITAEDVRPHIELLAGPDFRGRSGLDALRTARYMAAHFKAVGLQPLFDGEFLQPIPGATEAGKQTRVIGRNVGALLPGSDPELKDEVIIISAHFDHLGVREGQTYAGADDNASGVSMLLETARRFASLEEKPRRSIAFVGFDLEERMLWGSRWFAAHPPWPLEQVKLFITADMIGRSLGDLPLPLVFVLGSEHSTEVRELLDSTSVPDQLSIARLGIDLIGTRSDYGPFRDREVPFLFFSTGEHPDYHTPQDTPERIDYPKVARVSTFIADLTTAVANTDEPPKWTEPQVADVEEARTLNRITSLLLEADKGPEIQLGGMQRFFVSQVHSKTDYIVRRGDISAAERKWLTRAAQLLMLSVF